MDCKKQTQRLTLTILSVATIGLAGCLDVSSKKDVEGLFQGGETVNVKLTPQQLENLVAGYGTTLVDNSVQKAINDPKRATEFAEQFITPFEDSNQLSTKTLSTKTVGSKQPSLSESDSICESGSATTMADSSSRFVATFADCLKSIRVVDIGFGDTVTFILDGAVDITKDSGYSAGGYEFSYILALNDYSVGVVDQLFDFNVMINGDMKLDYSGESDWALSAKLLDQQVEGSCGRKNFKFSYGLRDMTAVRSPSSGGASRVDLTKSGKIAFQGLGKNANGEYAIETLETITFDSNLSSLPDGGKIRITGPDGFDITLTYDPSGYLLSSYASGDRFVEWNDSDNAHSDNFDFLC